MAGLLNMSGIRLYSSVDQRGWQIGGALRSADIRPEALIDSEFGTPG